MYKVFAKAFHEVVGPDIHELKEDVKVLKADVKDIKEDIDTLNRKFDATQNRADRHGVQLEGHEKRIHKLETASL
jgi:peptidoglycan hydrolase CwlO-like protein